jgi:hypothetical protein
VRPAHRRGNVTELLAAADAQADGAVARRVAGAREDDVADAAEAEQR